MISVIIPVYEDWGRLISCLNALTAQTYPGRLTEVIVVNNESKNEVPPDLKLPEFVKLVHEPTPGSYAARNKGAEVCDGNLLLFTDSDCQPEKDWIRNTVQLFHNTDADMVGGRIKIFKPEHGSYLGYIYDKYTAFPQYESVKNGHSVTANFAIRREVFEKLRGFRSDMKSGGDWEFTERATVEGHNLVYDQDSIVFHPSSQTLSGIFKKQKRLTSWGSLNAQKKYNCSALRVMGSSIKSGWKKKRNKVPVMKESIILSTIDTAVYFYRVYVHLTIVLGLGNPEKIRR